jgi:hypothetical protein
MSKAVSVTVPMVFEGSNKGELFTPPNGTKIGKHNKKTKWKKHRFSMYSTDHQQGFAYGSVSVCVAFICANAYHFSLY